MSQINFNNKVENGGATADGKVSASDMNQIKTVVNANETQQINGDVTTLSSANSYTDTKISPITTQLDLKASITPSTKNLFNPYNTIDNYFMGNSGTYSVGEGFCVSDFIPVTPGTTYVGSDGTNVIRFTAYFDINKNVVAGGSNTQVVTFTPPAGVAYVKITIPDVKLKFLFQFEIGTTFQSKAYRTTGFSTINNPPILPAKNISNVRKTRNLFNKNTVTDNYYIDGSGNLVADGTGTYCFSDFIEIQQGIIYYGHDGVNNMRFISYYDANKNVVLIGDNIGHNTFVASFTSGVKYVIISIVKARKYAFQLELGTALSFYQPYGIISGHGTHGKNIIPNNSWNGGIMGSFGDSLTAQNAWQPIVADELGLSLLNYGQSGTKVADPAGTDTAAMCRDARINAISPTCQLLTFLGGTNDWAQNVPLGVITDTAPTTFYGALNTVATKLMAILPTCKIIWMTTPYGTYTTFTTPTAPYEKNDLGLRTSDYGKCIIDIARLWGFPCIDLHGNSGINNANYSTYLTDRLHWNGLGGTRVARLVLNELQKIDMYP